MKLEDILNPNTLNLAEKLDDEELRKISATVLDGYKTDLNSISEWLDRTEEYIKLAAQIVEEKSFPWPDASNVKYPLLTTAAVQFSARSYPALVSGTSPVQASVIGFDPTGKKLDRAHRISRHMSYELLYKMEEWEEDMDRTLMALPIVGTAFKKTYYCPEKGRNVSELINPLDFVVNYFAKSVDSANRKFHRMYFHKNDIVTKIRMGYWRDIDVESLGTLTTADAWDQETQVLSPQMSDEDAPIEGVEAHVSYDLDGDGYAEPYVITVLIDSGDVVKMVPRFDETSVEFNQRGEVQRITSDEYFTNFIFIPDPVSPIYGLGFGHLLGPLNDTANTIINQLIDAGTLATVGGGFLGRGFKIKNMGTLRFKPGEWKTTQSTGDDMRKSIFPLPVRDPSPVLFNLLGMVIDSGQKLSATMDIMMGESPGQNQPATTTMAVLEQGLKVFTSIHKRVYRSFKKELQKMFKLNSKYLSPEEYFRVLDIDAKMLGQEPMQPGAQPWGMPGVPGGQQDPRAGSIVTLDDYKASVNELDIAPTSDPTVVTQAQRLMKAEALIQLQGAGFRLDRNEVLKRVLLAQEQPNIEALIDKTPPQPNPEFQLEQQKFEHQVKFDIKKLELEERRVTSEAVKDESQGIAQRAKARSQIKQDQLTELQTEAEITDRRVAMITQERERLNPAGGMNESPSGMAGTRPNQGTFGIPGNNA